MKNILLASTSTLYGENYLNYLKPVLKEHFKSISKLIFIPYAQPGGISLDEYTEKAHSFFKELNIEVIGLHLVENKKETLEAAEAVFTGGGNTFLLLKKIYNYDLVNTLKTVLNSGTPYLGTSAGSNIGGMNIRNTNDMPIVYPPSFDGLGLIPFNLNPHYLDPIEGLEHNGETRETRIVEYLHQNTIPVVGLREGSWLEIKGKDIVLRGNKSARIFENPTKIYELATDSKIEF